MKPKFKPLNIVGLALLGAALIGGFQFFQERVDVKDGQLCMYPFSNALAAAVKNNPEGICMGGEIGSIVIPPAFVDNNDRGIPNLRPQARVNRFSNELSCFIPCAVAVKDTCLKDLGVSTRGANYDENPVKRNC